MNNATFWKRKLLAYLHDPPSKCADIRTHELRSESAMRAAGFTDEELRAFSKQADITASSADRFPFPASRSAGLTCAFDGVRAGFHHPMGPDRTETKDAVLRFGPGDEVTGYDALEGTDACVQPVLRQWPEDWDEAQLWRARFFAHWRLWPGFAEEYDARFAFLPADTRLPDHTIWNHNAVVSALAGTALVEGAADFDSPEALSRALRQAPLRPAFLKFQLGPVQEFIAQARSTRDLWSGSYLLSWLMAAGIKRLAEEVGPDTVIFPNLRGQPLFDLLWRDELWSKVRIGSQPVWEFIHGNAWSTRRSQGGGNSDMDLLTPSLPNVFFAVVPAPRAAELGAIVSDAIQAEWRAICRSVWDKVADGGLLEFLPPALNRKAAEDRFHAHTRRLLDMSWHSFAWPETLEQARTLAKQLPRLEPDRSGSEPQAAAGDSKTEPDLLQRFDMVKAAATGAMPIDHRDPRYYVDGEGGPRDQLNNRGLAWALAAALASWELDSVRQTRKFPAWDHGDQHEPGVAQNKDALTGREEMLFGGSGFVERVSKLDSEWGRLFKHDDEVGAITLVKRVWHWSWLHEKWRLKANRSQFPMPNTRAIAASQPFANDSEDSLETTDDDTPGGKYFAVMALDGDQIGRWISGDRTPFYETQFAAYLDSTESQPQGALEYFRRASDPDGHGMLQARFKGLLGTRRLVSPSYHLQFSEALSNFALRCARPIIEAFQGRLVYAGGDDVLAFVPAEAALKCASALRTAFQGRPVAGPGGETLFQNQGPGFLVSPEGKDQRGRPIPFLVPGPAADCSVGIAIAHFKSPLQDVVRAAQSAEKRAKNQLGRRAVAVTLMKRSGEIIEWGCQWDSGGLEVYDAIMQAMGSGEVSGRFPHRVIELLQPYLTETSALSGESLAAVDGFPVVDIALREIRHALERQGQGHPGNAGTGLASMTEPPTGDTSPLVGYLETVRRGAQGALDQAKAERGGWARLAPHAQRRLERLPVDAPLRALIGLCQTAAFVDRNRSQPGEVPPSTPIPSEPFAKPTSPA